MYKNNMEAILFIIMAMLTDWINATSSSNESIQNPDSKILRRAHLSESQKSKSLSMSYEHTLEDYVNSSTSVSNELIQNPDPRISQRKQQSQEMKSLSISDEHPLEDYVNVLRDSNKPVDSLRSYRSSCRRKIERFCVKACRKSYREVCSDYRCRSSARKAFKKSCKYNCKSYY